MKHHGYYMSHKKRIFDIRQTNEVDFKIIPLNLGRRLYRAWTSKRSFGLLLKQTLLIFKTDTALAIADFTSEA